MVSVQLDFALRTTANVKTVHLLGSWDRYAGQIPLSKTKPGSWKGTFRFQNNTIKCGGTYWYYVCVFTYTPFVIPTALLMIIISTSSTATTCLTIRQSPTLSSPPPSASSTYSASPPMPSQAPAPRSPCHAPPRLLPPCPPPFPPSPAAAAFPHRVLPLQNHRGRTPRGACANSTTTALPTSSSAGWKAHRCRHLRPRPRPRTPPTRARRPHTTRSPSRTQNSRPYSRRRPHRQ